MDEDEEDVTAMRVYGLDNNNENVCVRIDNFTPFVYLELPENVPWTASKAQQVGNKLDAMLGDRKPLVKRLMYKKRLYYAHLDQKGRRKKFPYLFLSFSHQSDIRNMSYKIRRPLNIIGIGNIKVKMHEQDASPILQFVSYRNVSTAGWIDFVGKRIGKDDQITRCDHEFKVRWKNVTPNTIPTVAAPLIMGFDIEVNSTNPSAMPKAEKPGDKVFQISCVLFRHGDDEKNMEKCLLTLGEPDPKTVGEDTEIYMYETEHDLLIGYTEFIQEKNPNIIVGYNILNFDIPYMIDRAKMNYCIFDFDQQGFNRYGHAKEKTIKWSSSAYGNQTFQFLDAEGRLYVDLLPLVKRDYKMDNYKLKTISTFFLGSTKEPLSVKGIFKCYRIGIKNKDGVYSRQAQKAMGIVGKYCLCENTRVSGKHGSIPIENLYGENLEVLSWNEKTDKLEISVQSNFFDNGKKECIELELEDGRTIICTPDHKLVTENGWINADDIPVGGKVKVGPILPEVELDTNETIYARVLGYMITDGHISKQRCVGYFGNLLDAQVFCDDIKTLCGIKPEIRKKSLDNCWLVSLPKNMKYKLLAENWIKGGNRTGSKELLPDVSKWSKSQIREFIAGMFGGDGWCPCYNKGDDKFTPIGLTQSRNNKDDIDEYVEKLSNMLKMFDISSSIRIAKRDNLFIGSLSLSMHDIEKFVTTIGYRYCYHKTIRSSIATFYYRIKNKAIRAYKQFYDQVITSDMSIAGAYREYVNRYTYAPTYGTMKSWARKGFPTGRPDQACRSFPKVGQFLNRINVIKLFEGDDYHSYSLDKNCDTLPTFELSLISKKSVGIKQVYDITVEDTHSFLANGIVAHNCVQDSALVIRLFNKLQTWIGLCEMAKTCNVPIFYLYTQGQQIKVYSQLYKYCFTEDTKVSLVHGNVPIKMLEKNKDKVLSWDEKTDQIIQSKQVRFFNNGKHDCISLEFEDGRTITCTPDHLFADTNGKWIKAFDIKLGSRVKIGPVLPDVSIDTYETILARILGYIVTDGHMSKHRNKSCAFLGTLLDADIFANDIEKLCRFKPKIKKDTCKSNCFTVGIPVKVVDMINNIDGIYCGNRTTSSNTCLPTDLAYWNKDRLREFLGGLFGGDGWSCSYNKITNSFTQLGFTQSRTDENCLQDYFQILASCLEKFDIQSKYNIILKNNNYVGSLIIQGTQNLYNFVDKIGYRYCYNKTMRTSVAYMYYKLKDRVKKDKQDLFNRILSLKNSGLTITMAYKKAIQNIPTSEYMPTVKSYMRYIKNGFVPHTNIVSYKFIKVSEFIELTGSNKCFMNEESYHSHQITKTQTYIPTFSLKLVGRKEELKQTVYDIEVENTHSFMANGVVVHNCMYKNIVVEKDGYVPKDNEHYVGATVFEPKAGVYDRVIPFDFASLYPTTIIAYNIDYSTLVTDPSVPDSDCHVMEWEDHVGCEHDKSVRKTKPKHVMCDKRYFRFLKEPKGVMPTVLQNLLDARAHTRKQIKVINKILDKKDIDEKECKMVEELIPDVLKILTEKKKIPTQRKDELKTLTEVLEKRQLAYKVSANSMYGAMGVTRGYLPFMPGAMATTAMGRKNIGIVAETIPKKFGGKLIYGDTDSNYIVFPHLETAAENWDHALHVATEVTKMFPTPICLEFENEIYWRFFILTKKRYMYKKCMRDGVVDEKIGKKGVLLARRDNSMFIRNAYETLIMMVFNRKTREEILFYIIDIINKLCSHFYSYKDFIVTKSIGNHGGGQVVPFINEKGQKKGKMGDYTVPLLSTEPKERERQFKLKNCNNAKDYYTHCLPAVVQLAERMRQRGQRVDPGTRLEYVISDQGGHKAKQYVKVEDAIYFSQHSSVLKLDYMYYMKLMANPFDDVLNVLYNVDDGSKNAFQKDFVLKQYKFRLNVRTKVLNELKDLIAPTVTFGK